MIIRIICSCVHTHKKKYFYDLIFVVVRPHHDEFAAREKICKTSSREWKNDDVSQSDGNIYDRKMHDISLPPHHPHSGKLEKKTF